MQEKELIINGKALQLSDATRIGVTFQANNLGELQNRQGNFTNVFKVPRTSYNEKQLEHVGVMTSDTLIPYRKSLAIYRESGIEVISNGEAVIKEVDKNYIHIAIVGGNVDLSKAIGDVIVGDLYADVPFYVWNFNNVYDSRYGTEYYIHPLIDWRIDKDTFFDNGIVDPREMLPTLRVTDLFDKLESYTGYTFSGDYLESKAHKNMLLTPDEFTLSDEYIEFLERKALYENYNRIGFNVLKGHLLGGTLIPEGSSTINIIKFPYYETNDPEFTPITGYYYPTVNEVAILDFKYSISTLWVKTESYGIFESAKKRSFDLTVQIKGGGTILAQKKINSGEIELDSGAQDYVGKISTGEILLTTGTQYYVVILIDVRQHDNIESSFQISHMLARFSKSPTRNLVYTNDLYFRDIFRMKAKDVLKDILNKRGVVIQTDSYTKTVKFNYFDDLLKNKAIAKDWSDKVDVSAYKMTFKFGSYGQRNWFRHKEREDVPNGLGDFYFDIDDTTLAEVVDVVELKHPATVQESKYNGYNIPKIEAIDQLNKWQKPDWRLLQLEQQPTFFNVQYNDGTVSAITDQSIPFARFVGFDETVPDNYNALAGILDRTKPIILPIKLNAIDVQNIDYVIPVFLDVPELDIHDYFYINKISNYKEGVTNVELVRL